MRSWPAPEVLDDPSATTADLRLLQHDHLITYLKIDFGVWKQTEPLANLLRYRDLALGGDFH